MTERPILFSAPMVRAILDGSKTQTRRIVKPGAATQACARCVADGVPHNNGDGGHGIFGDDPYLRVAYCEHSDRSGGRIRCPYGQPGDRLWVQERCRLSGYEAHAMECHYTDAVREVALTTDEWALYSARKFPARATPGRFMYRSCSRITLAIESVRVERLQAITEEDARAEGCDGNIPCAWMYTGISRGGIEVPGMFNKGTSREHFATLWRDINGIASWDANPWVWVIGFSRVKP